MKLLNKIKTIFKKQNNENVCPFNKNLSFKKGDDYNEYMKRCLDYYFENLSELKGKYFFFFNAFIRTKIPDKVTDKQIVRYLNGNIKFEDIKTYWEEIKELQNSSDQDIFNYIIGYDTWNNPIFDENLIKQK